MINLAWLFALYDAGVSLIFASYCPLCKAYVKRRGDWCAPCLSRAVRPHRLALYQETALTDAWAIGTYKDALGALIRDLKYRGKSSTLPFIYTALKAAKLPAELLSVDYAVFLPLYATRQKERGFNQTERIFADWVKEQHIPIFQPLKRTRATSPQYSLTKKARIKNVRGAFALCDKAAKEQIYAKRILLLDDILTTGATLSACADVLKQAGAASIYALVLASDRS